MWASDLVHYTTFLGVCGLTFRIYKERSDGVDPLIVHVEPVDNVIDFGQLFQTTFDIWKGDINLPVLLESVTADGQVTGGQ